MDKATLDTANDIYRKWEQVKYAIDLVSTTEMRVGDVPMTKFLSTAELTQLKAYIDNKLQTKKADLEQQFANL